MTLNLVTKRDAPLPPYTCEMVDIDTEGVPFMLSALWLKSQQYWWDSSDDQKYGRWLMNRESVGILMGCSIEITNRQDALFNMLDARLGGALRDVNGAGTEADPYIYDPPIPQTTDPVVYQTPGMQFNSAEVKQGMYNLLNGITSMNFPDARNFRQILEDILAALSAMDEEDQIALLQKLVILLGGVL